MPTPNAPLALTDRGHTLPALVFVHGFSCGRTDWELQLEHFAGTHRGIAVDLPGHGDSPRASPPTIAGCARAVRATIDALGLREVVLVGHSMGCRVISQVCRDDPAGVRGLVYVDGSFIDGDPAAAVAHAEAQVAGPAFEAFVERAYREFHVASTPHEVRARVDAHRERIEADFARPLVVDMVRWDVTQGRAALAAIAMHRTPAIAIQSTVFDRDLRRVPVAPGGRSPFSALLVERLPGVTIETIPCGHFPMLEAPGPTNAAIEAFLARIGAGPADR